MQPYEVKLKNINDMALPSLVDDMTLPYTIIGHCQMSHTQYTVYFIRANSRHVNMEVFIPESFVSYEGLTAEDFMSNQDSYGCIAIRDDYFEGISNKHQSTHLEKL